MHIVLGLLGSIVTILFLLDRLGIDLGGMNPFYWRRRRAWAKKYEGDPIYSIEDPVHVAALMIVGAAKLNGELSAEQKATAQAEFESNFSLNASEAVALLNSAAHLLGGPQVIDAQLKGLADRCKSQFTKEQADSMAQMMVKVGSAGCDLSSEQNDYINEVRSQFSSARETGGRW